MSRAPLPSPGARPDSRIKLKKSIGFLSIFFFNFPLTLRRRNLDQPPAIGPARLVLRVHPAHIQHLFHFLCQTLVTDRAQMLLAFSFFGVRFRQGQQCAAIVPGGIVARVATHQSIRKPE